MISVSDTFKTKVFLNQNQDIKTRFTLKNLPIDGPTPSTRYLFNKSRQKTGTILNTNGDGSGVLVGANGRFGINNNYYWTDDADDRIEFSDDSNFNKVFTPTSSYSISLWVEFIGTTQSHFFSIVDDASNFFAMFRTTSDKITGVIVDGGVTKGSVESNASVVSDENTIYNVVLTRNGAEAMKIYINAIDESDNINTDYTNITFTGDYITGDPASIGFATIEQKVYAITYWDGTALTPTQVKQHFNAGAQNTNVYAQDVDVSNYVTDSGSITRKLSYDIGKMSPTNISIGLMDDRENRLFLKTKKFAKQGWEGKNVEIDFSEDGSTWVNLFTGIISSKLEDLESGKVTITAKDLTKEMTDLKLCTTVEATEVFTYQNDNFADKRSFQQFIKYGTHAFISNNTDNASQGDRSDPFSGEIAYRNLSSADTVSGEIGADRLSGFLWYLPAQNDISTTGIVVKFWDYFNSSWIDLGSGDYTIKTDDNATGLYIDITGVGEIVTIRVDQNLENFSWGQYLAGDNGSVEHDEPDPVISVSFVADLGSQNPVSILYDLITSPNFGLELDLSEIDVSAVPTTLTISTANPLDFTWDKAWQFFEGESARINTDFKKQISMMSLINEIAKVTGLEFVVSGQKSPSLDRRVKIFDNTPYNYCLGFSRITNVSNSDLASVPTVETSLDSIKNTVLIDNFDPIVSSKQAFDTKKVTSKPESDIEKVLSLQSNMVYFYSVGNATTQIATRYLNRLKNPTELYRFNMGKAGATLETGDLLDFHDRLSGRIRQVKVIETNFNLTSKSTRIMAKRHIADFGPSSDSDSAKWAFYGSDSPKSGCSYYNVGPNGDTFHYF